FRLLIPDAVDPAYAPLKHTVDVPPMSRRTIEFYANEDRDWLFHCHVLYHMKAGMARIMSYPAGDGPRGAEISTPTSAQLPLNAEFSWSTEASAKAETLNSRTAPTYRPALGEHAM